MTLATTADYEAITGNMLDDPSPERTRVERLLELSESAVLAGANGQNIISQDYTSIGIHPFEGVAYLPQRPVSAVDSVVVVNSDGTETTLAADDYRFEPGGNGRPAKLIRRRYGRDDWWSLDERDLLVDYTAGWVSVPGQIIGMQIAMVAGTIAGNGGPAVISHSETLGGYADTDTYDAAEARQANYALTPSDLATLDRLCSVANHGSVPVATATP